MDINLESGGDDETKDFKPSGHAHFDRSQSHTGDGASPGKIFIGGLARVTTSAQFVKYFSKYGELTDSVIMRDRSSGQPRGFGFVTYADPSVVDRVIEDTHIINGKQVEIKRTIPKGAGSKEFKTKKIFVGGIPTSLTEDEFKDFFSKFGVVKEHQIMRDHSTNRSRGFGFISFEAEETVDSVLSRGNKIEMAGTQVEIKRAEPKKGNPPPPPSKRHNDSRPAYGSGNGDAYSGFGGGSFGPDPYRPGGFYGGRASAAYSGYVGEEFGGYGGYGAGGMGPFRGEPALRYSGRYGGGFNRDYNIGGGYGGPGDGYEGYAGRGPNVGYGSSYDPGFGGGYGSGGGGGPFFGGRGGYGGASGAGGRYHPYGR